MENLLKKFAIASEKAAIESQNVTIEEAINRLKANNNTKAKALRLQQVALSKR